MAHSWETFKERSIRLSDAVLLIISLYTVKHLSSGYRQLSSLRDDWRTLYEYGPGLICMNLGKHLAEPDAKVEFLRLLDAIRRDIALHPIFIPAKELNSLIPAEADMKFRDFETRFVLDGIDEIRSLVI